jgi:hypothetical protein
MQVVETSRGELPREWIELMRLVALATVQRRKKREVSAE